MTDEAKIPGSDAAGDGEIEMPPESARGPANSGSFTEDIKNLLSDPWDVGNAPPSTPITQPNYDTQPNYANLDLKKIPELDTYEELATQDDAATKDDIHAWREGIEKERIEEFRGMAENLKDTNFLGDAFADAAEQTAEELEAELEQRPTVDFSTYGEISKEGLTPDPNVVARYRANPEFDTYEELEAEYKNNTLPSRDQEIMKTYESQQRDAPGDVAEDVAESLGGFVEQIPFGREVGEDFGNLVWEGAENLANSSMTESEEANIEIHPPENDPGMIE